MFLADCVRVNNRKDISNIFLRDISTFQSDSLIRHSISFACISLYAARTTQLRLQAQPPAVICPRQPDNIRVVQSLIG